MHKRRQKILSKKTKMHNVAEKGLVCFLTYYPGFINLPYNQWFTFEFEGELIGFNVIEHLEPLHYIGFNKVYHDELTIEFSKTNKDQTELISTITTTDGNRTSNYKSLLNPVSQEVAYTRHYTKLFFCSEGEMLNDKLTRDHKQSEKLDEVVRNYRNASGDYRIPLFNDIKSEIPFTTVGFRKFNKAELSLSPLERITQNVEINFPMVNYSSKLFDRFESSPLGSNLSSGEISNRFNKFLNSKNSPRKQVYFDGLGMAIRAFVSENYKFAFLEVFMLLEVVVSDFLTCKKINAGVSKTKLDDFSKGLTFSYMLSVEVPIFVNDLTDAKRTLIGRVDDLRKKRNYVIHDGAKVSEAEARNAIETIQEFVILLDENEDIERTRSVIG
jgi:hypothetical protein